MSFDPNEPVSFNKTINEEKPKQPAQKQKQSATNNPYDVFDVLRGTSVQNNINEELSELLNSLNDRIKTSYPDSTHPVGLKFALFDTDTKIPVLIAHTKPSSEGKVVYYSILVEAGVETTIRPIDTTINGQSVQIFRDTSIYWDDVLRERIAKYLKANVSECKTTLNNSYMVLGQETELKSVSTQNMLFATAERNLMNLLPNQQITMTKLLKMNAPIDVSHNVEPGATELDMEKNPIFSDVTSSVSVTDPRTVQRGHNRLNQSANAMEQSIPLATVSHFLDFVFDPTPRPVMQNNEPIQPIWHPIWVQSYIRGMDVSSSSTYESIGTVVYALSASIQLIVNQNWKQVEIKNRGGHPSIGNLGFGWATDTTVGPHKEEVDISTGYGMSPQNGTLTLDEFSRRYVYNDATLAIDYLPGSRQNWFMALMARSVLHADSNERAKANRKLIEIFDEYLGGKLKPLLPENATVLQPVPTVTHVGPFKDNNDNLHDIREITVPSFCEILQTEACGQNMVSFQGVNAPNGCRGDMGLIAADDRRKVLENILNSLHYEFKIKQAHRFFYNNAFLNSYAQAFAELHAQYGLSPRSEGLEIAGYNHPGVGFQFNQVNLNPNLFVSQNSAVNGSGNFFPGQYGVNNWGR